LQFLEGEKQFFADYLASYLMVYLKFPDTIKYASDVIGMMRDGNYRDFYQQQQALPYYNTHSTVIMNKINYEGQLKDLWSTQSKINRNLKNGTLVSNVDFYTTQLNNYKFSTDSTITDYVSKFLYDLFNTVTNVNKEIKKIVYQSNEIDIFSSKTLQSYSMDERKEKRRGDERKGGEENKYISLSNFAAQHVNVTICDVLPGYIKSILDSVTDYYKLTKIRLLVFRKQSTLMGDTLLSVAINVNTIYTSMVNLENNTLIGFGLPPPYQHPLEAYNYIIETEWRLIVDYYKKVVSIYTDMGDKLVESLTSDIECKDEIKIIRRTFEDAHIYMKSSVDRAIVDSHSSVGAIVYPYIVTNYTQHKNRCAMLFTLDFSDGMIKYYERVVTYIKNFDCGSGGSGSSLSKIFSTLAISSDSEGESDSSEGESDSSEGESGSSEGEGDSSDSSDSSESDSIKVSLFSGGESNNSDSASHRRLVLVSRREQSNALQRSIGVPVDEEEKVTKDEYDRRIRFNTLVMARRQKNNLKRVT
jgi:hypothetical protein